MEFSNKKAHNRFATQPIEFKLKKASLFRPIQTVRIWSGKRDSNSRHSRWQRDALPAELFPHKVGNYSVFFLTVKCF
jgi:hypothetical protein